MQIKLLTTTAVAAALSLIAGSAFAQTVGNTASATGTANTTIIQSISVTAANALSFGTIVKPTAGSGTVTITAAGARSAAGGAVVAPGSAAATAASFTVAGQASTNFAIASDASTTLAGPGGATIPVTLTASSATGSLNASGAASFTVGGVMTIDNTTPAGTYTGSFNETVTYN